MFILFIQKIEYTFNRNDIYIISMKTEQKEMNAPDTDPHNTTADTDDTDTDDTTADTDPPNTDTDTAADTDPHSPGLWSVASAVGGRYPRLWSVDSAVLGRTPPYDHPALCIPRGLGKITHEELTTIINQSGLGEVYKIIIKPKEFILPKWERTVTQSVPSDDTQQTVCYNNIYIYFKKWNTDNPNVRKYRDNIINGQSIKIVYNTIPTPIFWRCVAANFNNNHYRRPEMK